MKTRAKILQKKLKEELFYLLKIMGQTILITYAVVNCALVSFGQHVAIIDPHAVHYQSAKIKGALNNDNILFTHTRFSVKWKENKNDKDTQSLRMRKFILVYQ